MSNLNIYQKLIEVRKVVPYLKKDADGVGFKCVTSSQVLGVLKEKMDSFGLLLIPKVVEALVGDHTTKQGGHNYFTQINMIFTWINADNPEEKIECQWYGQGLDTGERGVGKAYTYAEKYFLLKFFNIATDKDDPDVFQTKIGSKTNSLISIEPKQIDEIKQLIIETETDESKFCVYLDKMFGKSEIKHLNKDDAEQAIAALKEKKNANNN